MSYTAKLIVNEIEFSVDLPEDLVDSLSENFKKGDVVELDYWKSKGVAKSLALAIPTPDRPASYSQINYAESIAKALDIDLPEDISKAKSCRNFLDKYVEAFQEQLNQKKTLQKLVSKAVRTSRLLEASKLVDSGLSLESVAEQMEVKLTKTIEDYLSELMAWEKTASETEEYRIVMKLIAEKETGVDLHKKYVPYP
ncbi:hypothetical protein [Leucothrix arctica]|uniref:Uncharacterized protein n=1 Tax=Leucothrix arctica TaxID=1481894 RepID=A0A317C7R9_9GAMM|nr:hypothetical protein [Leucothrix arctica]PWQ94685.1 hypothetical protein DKT75_15450 [Leucothrix arctica]